MVNPRTMGRIRGIIVKNRDDIAKNVSDRT